MPPVRRLRDRGAAPDQGRRRPQRPRLRLILEAWHTGWFEMLVSYDQLYELEAVLMRPYFRSKLTY